MEYLTEIPSCFIEQSTLLENLALFPLDTNPVGFPARRMIKKIKKKLLNKNYKNSN